MPLKNCKISKVQQISLFHKTDQLKIQKPTNQELSTQVEKAGWEVE